MILAEREGIDDNIETLTTRTSMSEGENPDLSNSFWMVSWKNSSISEIPSWRVGESSRAANMILGP